MSNLRGNDLLNHISNLAMKTRYGTETFRALNRILKRIEQVAQQKWDYGVEDL